MYSQPSSMTVIGYPPCDIVIGCVKVLCLQSCRETATQSVLQCFKYGITLSKGLYFATRPPYF